MPFLMVLKKQCSTDIENTDFMKMLKSLSHYPCAAKSLVGVNTNAKRLMGANRTNEKNIILGSSDVEIFFKDIEGWQVAQGGGMTVALDMKLSPELKKEGIARELVNRVQNHRKDRGLEVTDKIDIFLKNEPKLEAAVLENKTYILSETLAKNLYFKPMIEEGYILEFEDIKTEIFIKKIFS